MPMRVWDLIFTTCALIYADYACALDGEYGLMSRSFRSFSFSKSMSTKKAMSQCLKAFYLIGDPKDYSLYEMNEKGAFTCSFTLANLIPDSWSKGR